MHLDVFYRGKPVVVPQGIGIGPGDTFFSELHTHDSSGVVHVESPRVESFTLGEFFKEWGVPLNGASAFVDGVATNSVPGALVLSDQQEIGIVFGAPPAKIPVSFDWTAYWNGTLPLQTP